MLSGCRWVLFYFPALPEVWASPLARRMETVIHHKQRLTQANSSL